MVKARILLGLGAGLPFDVPHQLRRQSADGGDRPSRSVRGRGVADTDGCASRVLLTRFLTCWLRILRVRAARRGAGSEERDVRGTCQRTGLDRSG